MTSRPDLAVAGATVATSRRLRVVFGLGLAGVVLVLDQITKELAEAWLEPGVFVPFLGPQVGWQLVYNPGASFGLPAPSWLLLIVAALVVTVVARLLPRAPSLVHATALGLLMAGALGNLIDRAVRAGDPGFLGGHVVDFIAWGWWPRFNVADSAITVGVVLLFVALIWEERATARAGVAADPAGGDDAEQPDDSGPVDPAGGDEPDDPAAS